MSGYDHAAGEYIDSLRLSPRQQAELLEKLAKARPAEAATERRSERRVTYQNDGGLIVQMHQPGGTSTNYLVRARNLSTMGVAFLHGAFVYSGTSCAVALMSIAHKTVRVEGQVVRCHLVSKHIHEVGIRFEKPVRVEDFIAGRSLGAGNDRASTELPQLGGHVLYIEDSISDQELLKFFLKKLGTSVETASNGLEALDLAQRTRFDAVITDMWLPAMSGSEIAQALREKRYAGPIIALTADEREDCQKEAIARGCTCVLAKPCSFEHLADVLSKHLPHRSSRPPESPALVSELWGDVQIRPLIRAFLKHLEEQLSQMQQQLDNGKRDLLIQKMCLDVKGSAGGYGFSQISVAAAELLELLTGDAPAQSLKEQFGALSELCRSAVRGVEGAEHGEAPHPADNQGQKHD